MSDNPNVTNIRRHNGVAGQISYSATVTYPGEDSETATFVGSAYGGPVVMIMPSGQQVFVSERVLDRCGKFSPQWVRNFFA